MIIDFSIQNFGPIKDKQTLSFEADKSDHLEDYYIIKAGKFRILKLALIYGANASGKTNILKALHFLGRLANTPLEKKSDLLEFEPYLFDKDSPSQNSVLSINFVQNDVHYFYEVEFNKKCISREELTAVSEKKNIFRRITDINKQLTDIVFSKDIEVDITGKNTLIAYTLWNNTVLGGFLKTNVDIKEINDVSEWFKHHYGVLITPGPDLTTFVAANIKTSSKREKRIVLDILKKADFNIADIRFNGTKGKLQGGTNQEAKDLDFYFTHVNKGNTYALPFEQESKGTQQYFGLAGLLYILINENGMFSIDELESSLHPDLYTHFLLSFLVNAKNSQLIATTHYREILNNKDIFRNDAIWFTDKSETGATELYSLADFDTTVVRDTTSVYNAYKAGKLGGVPNLSDYYIDLDNEK